MPRQTITAAGELRRGSRFPILLSAFIYPGSGQFAQKRWVAGTFFMVVFSVPMVIFFVCLVRVVISAYRMAFDFAAYEAPSPPWARILISLAVSLVFYAANVVDVSMACRRMRPAGLATGP